MEMLQCRLILASLLVLSGCFLDVSCQTVLPVNTYTTKDAESLPCAITGQTLVVTWTETTVGNENIVLLYQKGNPPVVNISTEAKYTNFNYTLTPTSLNLVIENVEDGDGGVYNCAPFGALPEVSDVTVEVLVKPTVQYESQDVVELDVIVGTQYNLTCSATRARSVSDLSLMWDSSLVEKSPLIISPNGDYKDYSITSTYTAVRGVSSITCQLTGYAMQDEINNQRMDNIARTVNLNVQYAPECSLTIQEGKDCTEVTLTCECDAIPAVIIQYSFFNGSSLINNETSNTFTESVAYGTSTEFSCSATNDIGPGEKSDVKDHDCDKGTTAPQSTNEPTSTKAMGTTTVEPESKSTDNPESGGLGAGAIVGISLGALAVVIVIVVIAVMMFKPGEGGSKSESSNSGKGIENDGMDTPTDYAEVKMKSDKPDDNGAGPGKDPEIPAYGVIDNSSHNRNTHKGKAVILHPSSANTESSNSSEPNSEQQIEKHDAALAQGNKPPSDEFREPKKNTTE